MRALHLIRGFKNWATRPNLLLRASVLLLLIATVTMLPLSTGDDVQLLVLRTFAIVVLAFLPGWLFLRFVIVRAQSVWDEYVLNLHRLGMDRPRHLPEPPVNSIYHEEWLEDGGRDYEGQPNIYRDKFDAYYGKATARDHSGGGGHLKAETFFPVFLATAVFAAGWAAVLGGASLTSVSPAELSDLATTDMMRLGFVGAYLFTLQMLLRRYFQADLKASAYVNAVTRVVSALVLVLVADLALLQDLTPQARVAAAFVIGFFPLVGLQALQKATALVLRTVVPSLRNDYPLSDLDGLSVWYEARLLELGIEDMENLATANLVDVTLHSRVPVSRLVDWVDQAHLYLHLEPRDASRRHSPEESSRRTLRRLGIRTATALEDALSPTDDATSSGGVLVPPEDNAELLKQLRLVLNGPDGGPSVTMALLKTFRNDPNLAHVRSWKRDWTEEAGREAATSATVPVPAGTTGAVLATAAPAVNRTNGAGGDPPRLPNR